MIHIVFVSGIIRSQIIEDFKNNFESQSTKSVMITGAKLNIADTAIDANVTNKINNIKVYYD